MLELKVAVCDGHSLFTTDIYVGHKQFADTVSGLDRFKEQIRGGLFNLRFGKFGPEYSSGALDVRMHFRTRAKLLLRVSAECGFSRFEDQELASKATLHLVSEPGLLDNFVLELGMLSKGSVDHAELEAVSWG
ncbi:hypothetical protein [Herbaspirillum sp. SJZ107]|uniref:hypothetical protein n=1 Tax=Herbaspirillum sp. SJZ107 TaxID=2572881 RepID=UPI00114D98C6|nr:hypothetical protein [Herbaspirillum sp. SJZ107]